MFSLPGVFHGFYRSGFESNEFFFCDGSGTAAGYLGLRDAPTPFVSIQASTATTSMQLNGSALQNREAVSIQFVEWNGTLGGEQSVWWTGFGLHVDRVISARAPRVTDCPASHPVVARGGAPFDTVAVIAAAWKTIRDAKNIPVDSMRSWPRSPVQLMLTPSITLQTVPVSRAAIDQLRQRAISVSPQRFDMDWSTQYALVDLRSLRDGRHRAIFSAQWFAPPNEHGVSVAQRRTDTALVTCVASKCVGTRPSTATR